jgi:hypothetical protein
MGLETKAGSALPLSRLGLGLGKGYAYAASGATLASTILGTALAVAAGALILGWAIGSIRKAEKPKAET